ncbi:MAG TPA: xanthine dehydrogenase family protein subunit M [Thermoanaerobaculia bacterium]|nr:xanthine dehydrogenase family protein subunit M [Thermoanaerobaculia bacterium]
MKPAPFDYVAPDSLEEALDILARSGGDAKLLAGGQSLIPVMNFRLAQPSLLIDLNRLRGLDAIYMDSALNGPELRLGALTRQRRLERDPLIAERAPLLREAVPYIAHPQIRNRGTVGGSIAHADPAAELPAVALALRARFRLQRSGGDRWVEARDFFLGLFTTVLEPEEMLTEIALPPLPPRTGWSFMEVARRHGDYAQAGLAALVTLDETGRCREARLVYLSVGDAPVEASKAAALLVGEALTPERIAAAAEVASREEMDPDGDIHASAAFKRHLARVLTIRALGAAVARAQREGTR